MHSAGIHWLSGPRRAALVSVASASALVVAAGCSSANERAADREDESVGDSSSALTTSPAPLGYWRFDDCAAGSTALRDSSGNALGATANDGVTCAVSGHSGAAVNLDGTSGAVTVPDAAILDGSITSAVTVAAWVKPSVIPTSSAHSYAVVTKWDNHADTLKLQLTSGGYKFTIAVANGTGGENQIAVQAPASLSTAAWTHVAGVYDGAKKMLTLYVNGKVAASGTASGTLRASSAPLRIGNSPSPGSTTYGFKGSIDEVWIGGQALSTAQIRSLASGPHSDAFGPCLEKPKKSNVLLVVYNPFLADKGQDLISYLGGNDPQSFSASIVDSVRASSQGLVNYNIVGTKLMNEWPAQRPGAVPLNEANFFAPLSSSGFTDYPGGNADYAALFQEQGICNLVASQNLSEVWVWTPNISGTMSFGFDELAYKIPNDALPFPTNNYWFYEGRKKNIPDCGKTVWVMGWNTNVGLDNAIHSYNHRVESILSLTVGRGLWFDTVDAQNPWRLFSLYDSAYPGQAGVGSVHFPANAGGEYDYGNARSVPSRAADFTAYPKLTGSTNPVDCTAWGCTQLGYQQWYQAHLPHASGTSYGGSCNDWWTYIADYDRRLASCSGSTCLEHLANGSVCASDSQCDSGTCACDASGTRTVCSVTGTHKACPSPNWDTCAVDADCQSGVCGCNGGPRPTVCLPNEQYPRSCSN